MDGCLKCICKSDLVYVLSSLIWCLYAVLRLLRLILLNTWPTISPNFDLENYLLLTYVPD